ncbi:hypothetical protein [uncultured Algibacter sp.]|uniref:hypothetical protein n=1 Tax=uncultured Algibacter sp. TaxID=298659 RepID=UPI0026313EB2|nr:hypothetical protein [uncultured Algibacter sp.]
MKKTIKYINVILSALLINVIFISCSSETGLTESSETEKPSESKDVISNSQEAKVFTDVTINSYPENSAITNVDYRRGLAAQDIDEPRIARTMAVGGNIVMIPIGLQKNSMSPDFPTKTTNSPSQSIIDALNVIATQSEGKVDLYVQISGTPKIYDTEDVEKPNNGNFYPLPTSSDRDACVENIASWMYAIEQQVNMPITWLGTQEPGHTLGEDSNAPGNKKEYNLDKFISYWNQIEDELKTLNANAKLGGIQLNSGNDGLYDYTINKIESENLQLDVICYQLYGVGGLTDGSIGDAVAATNSYSGNVKMVAHRTLWLKEMRRALGIDPQDVDALTEEGFNTSEGMIYFLRTEKQYQAHASGVEGYCVGKPSEDLGSMVYDVLGWLQNTPKKLRELTDLPNGVDGFVLAIDKKYMAALYNTSDVDYNITLNLNTDQYGEAPELNSTLFSGTSKIENGSGILYDYASQAIKEIELEKNDVILIELLKDGTSLSITKF